MITRERAIEVLEKITYSDIIDEALAEEIDDIVCCLNMEELQKISPWGMPDEDYMTLVTAVRTDLPEFERHMEKCKVIAKQYKLTVGEVE